MLPSAFDAARLAEVGEAIAVVELPVIPARAFGVNTGVAYCRTIACLLAIANGVEFHTEDSADHCPTWTDAGGCRCDVEAPDA